MPANRAGIAGIAGLSGAGAPSARLPMLCRKKVKARLMDERRRFAGPPSRGRYFNRIQRPLASNSA